MSVMSYLELVIGPMFSGKTSRLVEIYRKSVLCDIKVIAINYAEDKRYDEKQISTHDGVKIPCVQVGKMLFEYYDPGGVEGIGGEVIIINEGQFFDDLEEWVTKLLDRKEVYKVYVCGLDGDYCQKRFGHILDLVPLCNKVVKLNAICRLCKSDKGVFTKRLSPETTQEVIGSSDKYIAVCRNCVKL